MIDTSKLPFGGETILMSRLRKLAPEMVIISLLPVRYKFNVEPYAYVRAIAGKDYDWRFLKKLKAVVVCEANHASVGLFEQLCKEAFPVEAFFYDEQQGYDVSYLPTPESIERSEDTSTWTWEIGFTPWPQSINSEWHDWLMSSLGESSYV